MAQKAAVKKAKLSGSTQAIKPVKPESELESKSDDNISENEGSDDVKDDTDTDDSDVDDIVGDSAESGDSDHSNASGDEEDSEPVGDHFSSAMNAILGSKIKKHKADNPILIRNKRPAKEIEEAREESKARKAIRAEKLQHKDKARVRDVIPKDPEEAGDMLSNEKKLRKIAQRGVVKLLNAIHSAQSAAIQGTTGTVDKKAVEGGTQLSKEKFLDMIRMG